MRESEREDPGDDAVNEASDESFPASDPPSWEPLHAGRPAVSEPLVENNATEHRFEIRDPAGLAQLQYRYRDVGTVVLVHTEVPPALEGRGYASRLARTALDFARAHSLHVVPQCPFVKTYIQRHPDYDELVVH